MPYTKCDSQDLNKDIIRREVERQLLGLSNQPYRIYGKSNFIASLILAIVIYLIHDFDRPCLTTQLILQQSRQLQYVFQTVIMKQKVKYIDNIQDYLPWYMLYSKKSVKVQFQFVFHIGYKPQLSQIRYNQSTGNIWWEGSQMQIIHEEYSTRVVEQESGYINTWSISQFANISGTRAEQIKEFAKKQTLYKIQNENKVNSIQDQIKRRLLSIISKDQKSLSSRMLTYIDETVNSIILKSQNQNQNQRIQAKSQTHQNFLDEIDLIDFQESSKSLQKNIKQQNTQYRKDIKSKIEQNQMQKSNNERKNKQDIKQTLNKYLISNLENQKYKIKPQGKVLNERISSNNKKLQDKYKKLQKKVNSKP